MIFFRKYFLQPCMFMAAICMVIWLSGCAMVAGEIAAQGVLKARDEGAAASAMQGLKEEHPYIDFEQQFPETYLFNEHESEIWSRTLAMLRKNGESIVSQNKSKGRIVTETKQIPINEEGDSSKLGSKRIFYEQEINIESIGSKKTHVTNAVSCYKSDKYGINKSPISLPDPRKIRSGESSLDH